ncbi:hypothetical protein GCM10027094_04070 [Hafnia psychrotolerans]
MFKIDAGTVYGGVKTLCHLHNMLTLERPAIAGGTLDSNTKWS